MRVGIEDVPFFIIHVAIFPKLVLVTRKYCIKNPNRIATVVSNILSNCVVAMLYRTAVSVMLDYTIFFNCT